MTSRYADSPEYRPSQDGTNIPLFNLDDYSQWKEEWQDMPEYEQKNLMSFRDIIVHFTRPEDVIKFAEAVGQKITSRQHYIWFPPQEKQEPSKWRYVDESSNGSG
tara:strand:- start:2599 stop:2913 length:315 start_codon:yes stop_codon:yes gene_type:complete